jgi:excisionase family DNA binding protein
MDGNYITVNDAADDLNVSRATMWKWVKRQGMQTYRFMGDRKTYVMREDLEQLRQPVPIGGTHQKKRAA